MNILEKMRIHGEISKVFTPSAPVDDAALFAGRTAQLLKVVNAISQRGQHVVIFGERGVGKTSLANILYETLDSINHDTYDLTTVNCDASTNFSTLCHSIFRNLSFKDTVVNAGFTKATTTDLTPANTYLSKTVTPDDVKYLFEQLEKPTVIIMDEVDRIQDKWTTTRLADTIKTLSDQSIDSTFVLVGVADSVDDLIAEHKSIERALVQIQMPRMSVKELYEIMNKGLTKLSMTIDASAKAQIAHLSQGLPHYTHLLGLHASQNAVSDGRMNIQLEDVNAAAREAVDQAQQSIVRGYHKATSSPRGNLYAQVLLACALAPTDDLGYFSSSDVREPMSQIMKKRYEIPAFSQHLKDFCERTRGPILQRTGYPRRYRFRFINPLMEPYVIMNGLKKGLITEELLEAIQAETSASELGQLVLQSDSVS